jgi:hypothetical protein
MYVCLFVLSPSPEVQFRQGLYQSIGLGERRKMTPKSWGYPLRNQDFLAPYHVLRKPYS